MDEFLGAGTVWTGCLWTILGDIAGSMTLCYDASHYQHWLDHWSVPYPSDLHKKDHINGDLEFPDWSRVKRVILTYSYIGLISIAVWQADHTVYANPRVWKTTVLHGEEINTGAICEAVRQQTAEWHMVPCMVWVREARSRNGSVPGWLRLRRNICLTDESEGIYTLLEEIEEG